MPSLRFAYSPAILLLSLASSSMAALVTSIDFTPLEGSWATPTAAPIRVDFGNGIGTGTITFSTFNDFGGSITIASANYTDESYTGFDLGNENVLDLTNEILFSYGGGVAGFEGGVQMTVKLDNANSFTAGSLFAIRGLDWTLMVHQRFEPFSGLRDAPIDLPSETATSLFVQTDASAEGNSIYSPDRLGSSSSSAGLAFEINDNTDTFSVRFRTNANYTGTLAMTIATAAAVPEPSTWVLSLGALSGLLIRRR